MSIDLKEVYSRSVPVGEIMTKSPLCADESTAVGEVFERMAARKIGAMVITKKGEVAGIITERDCLRLWGDEAIRRRPVGEYMTPNPVTVQQDLSADQVYTLMDQGGFRHMPVLNGSVLVGIVSLRDLARLRTVQLEEEKNQLATLLDVAKTVSKSIEVRRILREIISYIQKLLHADRASVLILGKDRRVFQLFKRETPDSDQESFKRLETSRHPALQKLFTRDISIFDRSAEPELYPELVRLLEMPPDSRVIVIPIRIMREPMGLIVAALSIDKSPSSGRVSRPTPEVLEVCRAVALAAGNSIYNSQLYDDLLSAYEKMKNEIHEREWTQMALGQSEEKYRSLVSNIPIVPWTADSEGKTVFIGPYVERVNGYSASEMLAAPAGFWFDRIHPDDVQRVKAAYRLLFEQASKFDVEYRVQRKDGAWVWLHDRAITTYELGGVIYADGVFSDVTARKISEEAMEKVAELDRMASLGQLASGVAHEIKNALTGILGMAELLRRGQGAGDEVETILHEASRAAKVAQDLLMFARPQLHQTEEVDLAGLVRQVVKIIAGDLKNHRIDVRLNLRDGIPPIAADPAQLHQVILNLIINARDAMPGGGEIEVSLDADASAVVLDVADSGGGILPEIIPRIFDPFFSTKERGKGTGLGLSVARGIILAHGGTIEAFNRSRAGALFRLRLPSAASRPSSGAAPKPTGLPFAGPRGLSVLVVDDERSIREVCGRLLEKMGNRVVLAESTEEADRLLDRMTFDVILCDHTLNREDGLEFHRSLRDRGRPEASRFILMTGLSREEVRTDVSVLFKPIEFELMFKEISRVAQTSEEVEGAGQPSR